MKRFFYTSIFILICFDMLIIFYLISIQPKENQKKIVPLQVNLKKSLEVDITNKSINVSDIFKYQDPDFSGYNPNEIVLLATGDVILARSVNSLMVSKNNFLYPFEKTANFLKNSDITFINLESPLIPNCATTVEGMVFCGSENAVAGLVFSGVDVVSIANNHMADQGEDGINNTTNILMKNNIAVTGNGNPAILTAKGKKFGFLGYNDISERYDLLPKPDDILLQKDIYKLKQKVNYVIVAFHWGVEYTASPSARQVELAHMAIDNGADLVIGNHPHWVQGIEQYEGKLITYAHGNFVFDQMWSPETREGVIGKYVFGNNGLKSVNFYPIIIENYAQPRFAQKEEAVKILEKMKATSPIVKSP
ncbi:MAG: CapA family protein [Candidatus Gottesmanbacteria bacterium]